MAVKQSLNPRFIIIVRVYYTGPRMLWKLRS